jgi:polysaccharide deacetylase family protein (PEP-CTERM system associated)
VIGYRAATYSINESNLWALDVLAETGHRYSSSIYPIKHDLYGIPSAPRFRFEVSKALTEIPITTVKMFGRNWPCGGGGYFRLFPYSLSKWALKHVNERERQSAVFYFHPWEIDPDQPRIPGVSLRTRVRHYLNLNRLESRVAMLLRDFRWGRLDQVFALR